MFVSVSTSSSCPDQRCRIELLCRFAPSRVGNQSSARPRHLSAPRRDAPAGKGVEEHDFASPHLITNTEVSAAEIEYYMRPVL